MSETQIALLFGLFAGEEVLPEMYQSILNMAAQEVKQMLISEDSQTDTRLNYLAAAVAFLRYTEITAARDRAACTIAGTIAQNTDAAQKLIFAKELVNAYRELCRELFTR